MLIGFKVRSHDLPGLILAFEVFALVRANSMEWAGLGGGPSRLGCECLVGARL
jgi:hypothetical protein